MTYCELAHIGDGLLDDRCVAVILAARPHSTHAASSFKALNIKAFFP